MKIAYHQPTLDTINAQRTIYNGYKHAFTALGHDFVTYTSGMDLKSFLENEKPDIFITASHFFWRKQLDYPLLKKYRDSGMRLFCKIDFWDSPINSSRINEAKSLSNDSEIKALIKNGMLGDHYFHVVEQGDKRMEGFKEFSGTDFITVPLAFDETLINNAVASKQFEADISFIGTNLPQKKEAFNELLFPLKKSYDLKLYGQDWTVFDKTLGKIQLIGQYFNIPFIKTLRKPKLKLEDEYAIYASSKLCINLHEDYQRTYGGDCNERTFKIPASGCLEITDSVSCISNYFLEGEEIIIAKDAKDWFEKIEYYLTHEKEANTIAAKGRARVMKDHTYRNRAQQFIDIYYSAGR